MNNSTWTTHSAEAVPAVCLASLSWVEPEESAGLLAYACSGDHIFERRTLSDGSHTYRRSHWSAIALTIDWQQLPAFLWERVEVDTPADYERCAECGYDHSYEYAAAVEAHKAPETQRSI